MQSEPDYDSYLSTYMKGDKRIKNPTFALNEIHQNNCVDILDFGHDIPLHDKVQTVTRPHTAGRELVQVAPAPDTDVPGDRYQMEYTGGISQDVVCHDLDWSSGSAAEECISALNTSLRSIGALPS